jgi:hypothetical protein
MTLMLRDGMMAIIRPLCLLLTDAVSTANPYFFASSGRKNASFLTASYRPVTGGSKLDIEESAAGNNQVPTYSMEE